MVHRIALIRHGESVWNLENIFTGWTDVDLSATGKKEALQAGKLLRTEGFKFDLAYTSVLKRAIKTLQNVLEELDQLWVPVEKSWRLNERHYGDLQGRNKADTAKKFGDKQVHIWRRSYDVPPAELEGGKDDPRFPGSDRRYAHNKPEDLPVTESLKTTVERFMPLWTDTIAPAVKSGKNVIIAAHGNSLRALVKYLDNVSDEDIPSLEIPTGVPLIYELDDNLKPIRHYYVGTKEAFKKKIGFLGADGQAERMTDAFVHHGVVMKPEEIKYHAPKADEAIEKLGLHDAPSAAEVVKASDVLFLFGSLADIRDTIKSIKGDLKGHQIVVPVTKEGDLDVFQNAADHALIRRDQPCKWQSRHSPSRTLCRAAAGRFQLPGLTGVSSDLLPAYRAVASITCVPLSNRTGSLAGNRAATVSLAAMSPETLRQDLLGLRISNSDTNTILLPDSSQQHAFCARLFTLRELDCAVDLATLLQNLMLSAEACSKTHLSTFMHHCMTVYTHLGDPLYFMCGAPFEQLLLFEKPEDLADYAASQEYQALDLPRASWADNAYVLTDDTLAALNHRVGEAAIQ
ncbi:hypothetical protein WJX79_000674 [Trebouxia sp. C0005]